MTSEQESQRRVKPRVAAQIDYDVELALKVHEGEIALKKHQDELDIANFMVAHHIQNEEVNSVSYEPTA